jgi:predicted PurR-regulated permease PerM
MGKETGLHPVTVLFALLVGGKLFGALGVIAAIPVAGVLKGILLHQKKAKQKATEHGNTL